MIRCNANKLWPFFTQMVNGKKYQGAFIKQFLNFFLVKSRITENDFCELETFLPYPKARRKKILLMVQRLTASVGNLIMMNLQMARERVSQVETVWIMMLKLVWNNRKAAQVKEN